MIASAAKQSSTQTRSWMARSARNDGIRPVAVIRHGRHFSAMAQPTNHDPQAAGRLARQRFAVAFMSDTKWRKLFEVVQAARPDLARMIVKFVDSPEPRPMRFPPSLDCPRAYMDTIEFGPTELRAIEWLELEADLSAILTADGLFPLKVDEGRTRVIGYGGPAKANGS